MDPQSPLQTAVPATPPPPQPANPTPTPPVQPKTSSSGKKIIILAIIMLILLAAGFFGYKLLNKSKPTATNKINNTKTSSQNTAANATTNLDIKEFGIRVPLPASLKDTTYVKSSLPGAPASAPVILNLEIPSYTVLANKCLGLASDHEEHYATLIKGGGYAPTTAQTLKQFSSFYIANVGGSITDGTLCKDDKTQQSFHDFNTQLNTDLTTAFKNATEH